MKLIYRMFKIQFICFFVLLFYYYGSPVVAAIIDHQVISNKIDQVLQDQSHLQDSLVSISVRSATTGEILYDYNGNVRLKPASNMKILTAVAALSTLGQEYCFQTELLTDGKLKWGILHGNLYVKGKGDPTLLKSDIDEMVKNLKKQGIKAIRGNLIGDDTWYDDVRYSIDLPWSDETMGYGSAISALTVASYEDYDVGTVMLQIVPSEEVGEPAQVIMQPSNTYLEIVNLTKTVSEDEKEELSIERKHGTNQVLIEGTLPIHITDFEETIAVWEPTDFALHLFRQSLKDQGIYLLGNVSNGVTPDNAAVLSEHTSMPLADILIPFMKLSNNGHGEMLVKEMGKIVNDEGSWENGLEVTEQVLRRYGMNVDSMLLRDGSGISHTNLIPANELSNLLFTIQNEKWFSTFYQSLPIAGASDKMIGGTLKNRMKNTHDRIRAKTGTLTTVSTISGYVNSASGETFIFSILTNNMLDNKSGKNLEDQILMVLANF
ncbi:MAG: D-alanyl-D-alanine carboxypeptidase/D-alanyl-D-alanine-endopeptidase [Bacillaceae bacterium]|nr:D-alanyl-D-alanine carboxypeptidase/D-alanyl-D-alanine-endopeptidase [Bacillaceae bacterium]